MQASRKVLMWFLVEVVAGVALVASCTGTLAEPPGDGFGGTPREYGPACDPDGRAPCPDDFFVCTEDDDGDKRCVGQNPAVPDEGTWECYEEGTTLVCRGDHMPEGAEDWTCVEVGDGVVCRSHAYVPHTGTDEVWTCWYEGEFRVCESGEGTGAPDGSSDSGGGDSGSEGADDDENPWDDWFPDDDGNGIPDDFEDMAWDAFDDLFDDLFNGETPDEEEPSEDRSDDCVCVPGAVRYCDTPTYCRWGVQYCADDGLAWGECIETSPPAACSDTSWYSSTAEACCIESGSCCQDMWDLDMDGDTWESLGSCSDIVCG